MSIRYHSLPQHYSCLLSGLNEVGSFSFDLASLAGPVRPIAVRLASPDEKRCWAQALGARSLMG